MQKTLVGIGVVVAMGVVTWLVLFKGKAEAPAVVSPGNGTTQPQACSQEAKICPDGSAVGRVGPDCEFAACPSPVATSITLTASLGQKVSALGVSITPLEIVSDSRCPKDVQCIWAGTVEVKAKIESGLGASTMTLKLGEPVTTEAETITLTDVTPAKTAGETIPSSSYRFVFEVKKR
ncbi:hypothetical protein A2765_01420 [Candidatus Kaiserbacteria bacterium RIFCSPHIGHO2_01_FULL_56_24]|uniref:Uncharacterized protein n=1 Tax=Candidatus Kaiserbacteria bacterium RIFCSPHIGHO2_01_FULL_56_24 TaxID=1798487 RepID=A0A1F6DH98_9BACT|nr:MAG: hypothetical protein A2765_01420 [Candidatus Kaiserbacteria bacterium RIFCSPHIGHO2_01_FULL_56_24]